MKTRNPPRQRGLATRLLTGQTIVLLAGMLTAALVAATVGPPLFHEHLLQAGQRLNSAEFAHIELAYQQTSLLSLGLALLIALLSAVAVTWFLTRRLRQPLQDLTTAARELSRGHYTCRVPNVGSGTELDTLATAFNSMAARLEHVEDTRRRLLSDLAHEVRTPIATLAAYHDGLFDGIADLTPETRAVLSEQTTRLARLADDIDEVSTAQEGRLTLDLQPHQVDALLRSTAEELHDRFTAKGVELFIDTASAAGLHATADRQRIGQVLSNLLTNALRHTPPGGTVTVNAHQDGEEVTIAVTDNGEGIPADQLAHVFERFYRGDTARNREHSGSGIGLTISKAIIDAHGGTITAASAGPSRGTRFEILLPAVNLTSSRGPRPPQ